MTMVLWALLQALTVVGVLNFWRHLPADRQLEAPAGVVVILCLRDDWDGGAALMARLQRQDDAEFRLILATSGRCANADDVAGAHPQWVEVVSAGVASDEGQKIHKLRAALASLRPEDRYLVFIDADIVPPERLLGRLLFPLARSKADLSSGCRLLLPARDVLGIVGATEMQVATMPRLASGTMPWGGAMALTRTAADRLQLADALAGRLSDDLTIGLLARRAGLRLRAVRDLLVASPLDGPVDVACTFLVRQYRHVLTNCPSLWAKALGIVAVQSAAWGFVLVLGDWRLIGIGYGAAWARALVRGRILHLVLEPEQRFAARRSLLWDAVLPFAVLWLHLMVLAAAAAGRRIRWGGYDYWLEGGRVIKMFKSEGAVQGQ